jgi:hypothetical protein
MKASNFAPTFAGITDAIPVDDTVIILLWSPATDDGTPQDSIVYNVYLATASGAQSFSNPDATTPPGETLHRMASLLPGTTYHIVVRAQDSHGKEDQNHIEMAATTLTIPDTQDPIFGGATGAIALSEYAIEVSWTQATDDVTPQGFITYNAYVETSTPVTDFIIPDATSDPGADFLVVDGLNPSTDYWIVVRAEDAAGNESDNLQEVSARTWDPDLTPPAFGGVTSAIASNPTRVTLAWSAAVDNRAPPAEIVYNIYWSTTPGGQSFSIPGATSAPGALSGTALGLTPNTEYFFVVRAQDPSGNEDSNTVERSATTLVSFGANVLGILVANCTAANCHGGVNPGYGLMLDGYSSLQATAINVFSQESPSTYRILPGSGSGSYVYQKTGGSMPKLGNPLTQAERDLLRLWIDQGAQGN